MESFLFRIKNSIPRPLLTVIWVVLTLLVGVLDYFSSDYSLIIFYAAIAVLATLTLEWWFGLFISAFCASTGFISDILAVNHAGDLQILFNAVMDFLVYLLLTFIVHQLNRSLEQEKLLARTDFLTGALNLRNFTEVLTREIDRSKRTKRPFGFAYIDLDNFKAVNDRIGHSAGDEVLKMTVKNMRQCLRNIDTVARIGGDEFAILFPDTGEKNAYAAIRRLTEACSTSVRGKYPEVTMSVGLVTFRHPPNDPEQVIHAADTLMYKAKRNGKDRIVKSSR